jgi:hypothetical protein
MPGHREVHFQRNCCGGVGFDCRLRLGPDPRQLPECPAIRPGEKALELELVLHKRRAVQLLLDVHPEIRICQRARQPAGQAIHGVALRDALRGRGGERSGCGFLVDCGGCWPIAGGDSGRQRKCDETDPVRHGSSLEWSRAPNGGAVPMARPF